MKVAITGSFCAGKSFVLERIIAMGFLTFNSDKAIHEEVYKDKSVINEIKRHFPDAVIGEEVNKSVLKEIVFNDPPKLRILEDLLYPKLSKLREGFISRCAEKNRILFFEIPLLYEKGLANYYDKVIVVYASDTTKRKRAHLRGVSDAYYDKITSLQLSDETKKAKADYIINTEGRQEDIHRQLLDIIEDIKICGKFF